MAKPEHGRMAWLDRTGDVVTAPLKRSGSRLTFEMSVPGLNIVEWGGGLLPELTPAGFFFPLFFLTPHCQLVPAVDVVLDCQPSRTFRLHTTGKSELISCAKEGGGREGWGGGG